MDSYKLGKQLASSVKQSESIAGIMFVIEAEKENSVFDEITLLEHADMFLEWSENFTTNERGRIVKEIVDDVLHLYKNIHPILDKSQNIRPSTDKGNHMWKEIGNPMDEFPMWSQPIAGVDSPYMIGDKVTHKDKKWSCTIDNNWWEPGAYGWEEVL